MDTDLRVIYKRCDVSNNGTDDPLSFEGFKQWHQQEIAKARVDEIRHTEAWCNKNCCLSSDHVLLTHHADNPISRIAELSQTLKDK